MALKPYTVFCKESDNTGTSWIGFVLAESLELAKSGGLEQCCNDWNGFDHLFDEDSIYTPDNVSVIGVAEGDVNILFWEDL